MKVAEDTNSKMDVSKKLEIVEKLSKVQTKKEIEHFLHGYIIVSGRTFSWATISFRILQEAHKIKNEVVLFNIIRFIKSQLKRLVIQSLHEGFQSSGLYWKKLDSIWTTLTQIAEDSNFDGGFVINSAAVILSGLIDLRNTNRSKSDDLFDIQERINFIFDMSVINGLDVFLHSQTFIVPKYRKPQIFIPIYRIILRKCQKSCKEVDIFLRLALIAKVISYMFKTHINSQNKILASEMYKFITIPNGLKEWSERNKIQWMPSNLTTSKSFIRAIDPLNLHAVLYSTSAGSANREERMKTLKKILHVKDGKQNKKEGGNVEKNARNQIVNGVDPGIKENENKGKITKKSKISADMSEENKGVEKSKKLKEKRLPLNFNPHGNSSSEDEALSSGLEEMLNSIKSQLNKSTGKKVDGVKVQKNEGNKEPSREKSTTENISKKKKKRKVDESEDVLSVKSSELPGTSNTLENNQKNKIKKKNLDEETLNLPKCSSKKLLKKSLTSEPSIDVIKTKKKNIASESTNLPEVSNENKLLKKSLKSESSNNVEESKKQRKVKKVLSDSVQRANKACTSESPKRLIENSTNVLESKSSDKLEQRSLLKPNLELSPTGCKENLEPELMETSHSSVSVNLSNKGKKINQPEKSSIENLPSSSSVKTIQDMRKEIAEDNFFMRQSVNKLNKKTGLLGRNATQKFPQTEILDGTLNNLYKISPVKPLIKGSDTEEIDISSENDTVEIPSDDHSERHEKLIDSEFKNCTSADNNLDKSSNTVASPSHISMDTSKLMNDNQSGEGSNTGELITEKVTEEISTEEKIDVISKSLKETAVCNDSLSNEEYEASQFELSKSECISLEDEVSVSEVTEDAYEGESDASEISTRPSTTRMLRKRKHILECKGSETDTSSVCSPLRKRKSLQTVNLPVSREESVVSVRGVSDGEVAKSIRKNSLSDLDKALEKVDMTRSNLENHELSTDIEMIDISDKIKSSSLAFDDGKVDLSEVLVSKDIDNKEEDNLTKLSMSMECIEGEELEVLSCSSNEDSNVENLDVEVKSRVGQKIQKRSSLSSPIKKIFPARKSLSETKSKKISAVLSPRKVCKSALASEVIISSNVDVDAQNKKDANDSADTSVECFNLFALDDTSACRRKLMRSPIDEQIENEEKNGSSSSEESVKCLENSSTKVETPQSNRSIGKRSRKIGELHSPIILMESPTRKSSRITRKSMDSIKDISTSEEKRVKKPKEDEESKDITSSNEELNKSPSKMPTPKSGKGKITHPNSKDSSSPIILLNLESSAKRSPRIVPIKGSNESDSPSILESPSRKSPKIAQKSSDDIAAVSVMNPAASPLGQEVEKNQSLLVDKTIEDLNESSSAVKTPKSLKKKVQKDSVSPAQNLETPTRKSPRNSQKSSEDTDSALENSPSLQSKYPSNLLSPLPNMVDLSPKSSSKKIPLSKNVKSSNDSKSSNSCEESPKSLAVSQETAATNASPSILKSPESRVGLRTRSEENLEDSPELKNSIDDDNSANKDRSIRPTLIRRSMGSSNKGSASSMNDVSTSDAGNIESLSLDNEDQCNNDDKINNSKDSDKSISAHVSDGEIEELPLSPRKELKSDATEDGKESVDDVEKSKSSPRSSESSGTSSVRQSTRIAKRKSLMPVSTTESVPTTESSELEEEARDQVFDSPMKLSIRGRPLKRLSLGVIDSPIVMSALGSPRKPRRSISDFKIDENSVADIPQSPRASRTKTIPTPVTPIRRSRRLSGALPDSANK